MFVDHVLIVGNVRTTTSTIERELQIKARRSVQPRRDQREPAAADRARPVPARAHHRAAPRRRDRRAICSSPSRKRRRRPSATAAVSRAAGSWSRRAEGGVASRAVRLRAARVLRHRPAQRVRQEPIAEPVLERWPSTRSRATCRSSTAWSGTYREPRVFDTNADAFVNLTFEQQRRSSFNLSRRGHQRRHRAEAHAHGQRDAARISFSAPRCSTRSWTPTQPLIDRAVLAVPPVVVFRRR